MKGKHTAGPWHRGCGNGEGSIFPDVGRTRLEEGGTALYPIATMNKGFNEEEDEANADLIAAAPDLLAACKEFVRKCDSGEARSKRSYAQMQAAIAKAEAR